MAQLMIDTDTESVAGLMLLSRLLTDYANLKAANQRTLEASAPKAPKIDVGPLPSGPLEPCAGAPVSNAAGWNLGTMDLDDSPSESDIAPVTHPSYAGAGVNFGENAQPVGNVLPFRHASATGIPGLTPPPTITGLPRLSVNTAGNLPAVTNTVPSTLPTVQTAAGATAVASAPKGATAITELDGAGVPWDERIHSSGKTKKADGTWTMKKKLPEGLHQQITQELLVKQGRSLGMSANPSTSLPEGLPPIPNTVSLPPLPQQSQGGLPLPQQTPMAHPVANGLPGQGQPSTVGGGLPPIPADTQNPLLRFRAMMKKISDAQTAKLITPDQVAMAHKGLGLEQLQLFITQPDLIPQMELLLGLT